MKRCYTCDQTLAPAHFSKDRARKDGLFYQCKHCHAQTYARYLVKNREQKNRRQREGVRRLKAEVLCHYSGGLLKCACCGDSHIEFLGIDHVDGGGTKHRIELGHGGGVLYRWLKRNGYPTGYRVLCINCNNAIGLFGYCPHERDRGTEAIINKKRRQ